MPVVDSPTDSGIFSISVIGASGGIGQSLSLYLKTCLPLLSNNKKTQLNLFDVNKNMSNGVTTDLSHINTPILVKFHDDIQSCVRNANIIIICAGVPRKPGMTRDDLFNINKNILSSIANDILISNENLDSLFTLLISNPVNSLLPVLNSVLPLNTHSRNLGITNLDLIRASTFVSQLTDDLEDIKVIGGHSGSTIIPVLTSSKHYHKLDKSQIETISHRVQFGGDEVVKAKNGNGSATLSMAYAAFQNVLKLLPIFDSPTREIKSTFYVELLDSIEGANVLKKKLGNDINYFASECIIDRNGVRFIDWSVLNSMNEYENSLLIKGLDELRKTPGVTI